MDELCGFSNVNLRLSSSFIDKVTVDIPIIDFISRPHIHIKANSLYATLSLVHGQESVTPDNIVQVEEIKEKPKITNEIGQEESLLASLKLKIANNLNIELKKAKIILFSDVSEGSSFDLVLKIKNLHIVNNKQSPAVLSQIENLEKDADFENCNTFLSIGRLTLLYYDSSLKKTNKFSVLSEHKNIRLFNFNPNTLKSFFNRTLIKISETLELRVNKDIYKKICLLWNFMITRRQENVKITNMPIGASEGQAMKFESEFDFNNIQLHIVDDIDQHELRYIVDIHRFKLQLSHFASVFKQVFSFSSAHFKSHKLGLSTSLLSVLTSNLFTFELHLLHEKIDYFLKASHVLIKLFKLEDSLTFIQETLQVQEQVRVMNKIDDSYKYERQNSKSRQKIHIGIEMLEIELVDENEQTSKIGLQIEKLEGKENKKMKMTEISAESITFKIYETTLIESIEMKYLFDDNSQVIKLNRVPIKIDIQKLNFLLFKEGLIKEIDTFFQILSALAAQPANETFTPMPQEVEESSTVQQAVSLTIHANIIQLNIGYTIQNQFNEIMGLEIIQPVIAKQQDAYEGTFQVRSHLIERMTQHKMILIDKTRINLKSNTTALSIEANNLKLFIFPESIRELKRIQTLLDIQSSNQPSQFRMILCNKTFKTISLIEITNQKVSQKVQPNSLLQLETIDFNKQFNIRFSYDILEDEGNIDFNLHALYLRFYRHRYLNETQEQYFFEVLYDKNEQQYLMFVDCQNEDQFQITFLERYSILNKFAPGLKVRNNQSLEVNIQYSNKQESSIRELIANISSGFQSLDCDLLLNESISFPIKDIYQDKVSSKITLPHQVFTLPIPEISAPFEVIVFTSFLRIKSGFKIPLDAIITYEDSQGLFKKQNLVIQNEKAYNLMFQSNGQSERLSSKILETLKFTVTGKVDSSNPDKEYASEIKMSEYYSNRLIYLEYHETNELNSSKIITKLNIKQNFEMNRYLSDDLDLTWISQSHLSIPISIYLQPQLTLHNNTSEELFIMIHGLNEQQDPNQAALQNKVVIVKPEQLIDICSEQAINHYIQVGLKVGSKLVFSDFILTVKSKNHFITLIDKDYDCFLKIQVAYNRENMSVEIIVAPLLKIINEVPNCLILMQTGKEFQQVVINDKNTVFRMLLNEKIHFKLNKELENIPQELQQILQTLMNECTFELKMLDSNKIERHHILGGFKSRLPNLLKNSPYDIQLQETSIIGEQFYQPNQDQFRNVNLDFRYDENSQMFIIVIDDAIKNKTVFQILNKFKLSQNDGIDIQMKLNDSIIQIETEKTLQFSSERDFKNAFSQGWQLPIEILSQKYKIESEYKIIGGFSHFTLNLDPQQLVTQDEVIYRFKIKLHKDGFVQNKIVIAKYLKLSRKRLALTFECEDQNQQLQQQSKISLNTNLDIKVSLYPFIFMRDPYDNSMLSINVQDLSINKQIIQNQDDIEISAAQIKVLNFTYEQSFEQQVKMTKVLSMDEGFKLSLKTAKFDENLRLLKKIKISIHNKIIKIALDEQIKFSAIGFLKQIQTFSDQTIRLQELEQPSLNLLLSNFELESFDFVLSLDLDSKVQLQIEEARINLEQILLSDCGFVGDYLDYLNISLSHVTTLAFQSLHMLLYHSNFLGKFPTIFNEASRDLTETLSGPYKAFAMFPIMSIATKSVFQLFYNITSTFGTNIVKFTFGGSQLTDLQNYNFALDTLINKPLPSTVVAFKHPTWFSLSLKTLNAQQFASSFLSSNQSRILLYFDQCFIDIQGKNYNNHLVILSHTIAIVYEAYQIVKVMQFMYNNIRKMQFIKNQDDEYVTLVIGLKKQALAKVNQSYFQVHNNSLSIEIPRRQAEVLLSKLSQIKLIEVQFK